MVDAIEYARTKNIPFFGICLGMHLAIVEYARNVCGIKNAMSQEFDPKTKEPVIYLLTEFLDRQGMVQQRTNTSDMGGTLRLGNFFGLNCLIPRNRQLQLPGQSWQFAGKDIRPERGHRTTQA